MRRLSLVLIMTLAASSALAQSPHGSQLKIDCSSCHVPTSWKIDLSKMTFNHNTETSFKLTGQHASLQCVDCHKSLVFSNAKPSCNSCHRDVHQGSLGPNCASCHNTKSWLIVNVALIHERSRFPLVGAHQNVDCASCHSGYSRLYFPPITVACITCHSTQYYATTSPNHVQAGFSTQCQDCHNVVDVSWGPTNFNHDFFPLVAGHAISNCFACHRQGTTNFGGLSTSCYSCHKADYMNVSFPNHVAGNFSTNCQTCHTINGWAQASFDHSTTGFPLTGAHVSLQCASCHKNGVEKLSTNCYSCHSNDFASTTDPSHTKLGFPTNCAQCHNTTDWTNATFDHNTTGFPLTGAHASVQCAQCHTNGYQTPPPTNCYSCHSKDFNNTTDPNHVQQGFPTNCAQCHNTTDWTNVTFDHNTTGFPLTGAHATVACAQCHTNGYQTPPPTDCYSCHSTDYNNTTDPNHAQLGFPHNCAQCHSTTNWDNATFDHSTTGFPLTGAHTTVACAQCHTNGYTTPPPTDCYSCHTKDYNSTTDPNHIQMGYPTDCTQCHTTSSWDNANFDHTAFPITSGNHASPPLTCSQCHTTSSNFAIFSCTTSGCHTQSETDPHHTGVSGYVYSPTSCYSCHPTGKGD